MIWMSVWSKQPVYKGACIVKVTVSYGKRAYGNNQPSQATEINVTGSKTCHIKIDFKESLHGRSWDWLSCGSVGGAKIELGMEDAKSLAKLILEYAKFAEKYDPMEYDCSG